MARPSAPSLRVARDLASQFVHGIRGIELVHVAENVTMDVIADEGRFVLRLLRDTAAAAKTRIVAGVLRAVPSSVAVPRYLPARNGELVARRGGLVASCYRRIPGRTLGKLTSLQLTKVARALAALHVSLSDARAQARRLENWRLDRVLASTLDDLRRFPAARETHDTLARYIEIAFRLDESASTTPSVIHGDLSRFNIIVNGPSIGFIDFDDLGVGPVTYDIATVIASATPCAASLQTIMAEYRSAKNGDVRDEHVLAAIIARITGVAAWRFSRPDLFSVARARRLARRDALQLDYWVGTRN